VPLHLPIPSLTSSSVLLHPCPLQRQEVEILTHVDGLPTTRVRCPSLEFKIYRSTTRHRHVGVLSVGCFSFSFSFCTTAGVDVDVDVEQVSKRVLRSWLNASSPSPATIQLSHKSALQGQSLRIVHHDHVQDGVYLPLEPEGRTCQHRHCCHHGLGEQLLLCTSNLNVQLTRFSWTRMCTAMNQYRLSHHIILLRAGLHGYTFKTRTTCSCLGA